ncbi:MAG: hypothetical protein QXK88_09430 [Desulfurococcaceae archaeon]
MRRYLLPMLPVVYRNEEVVIYSAPRVSFPQEVSAVALVTPLDSSVDSGEEYLYAYDHLSHEVYNYTVFYDLDPSIFLHDTLIHRPTRGYRT